MGKNVYRIWKMYAKIAIFCMVLSASVILGFGVKAKAETAEDGISKVSQNSILKFDTTAYKMDGVNFQMAVSKNKITTNNVNSVDNTCDLVYEGYPVFYSGETIHLNAASPTSNEIKVIAYLVELIAPNGATEYEDYASLTDDPDWKDDDPLWYTQWYDTVEATLVTEGVWEYRVSLLCLDGTLFSDSIPFIILNKREDQIIYANSTYTKTYGTGGFNLNAKSSGTGTLSYKSSNSKVVTVSNSGWVNIRGYGTAKITINAAQDDKYYSASKTVTVKIIPNTVKITRLYSPSKGRMTCAWKKIASMTGYEMRISGAGKSFTITTKKNTAKGSGKSKKKYSVKVRAYKIVGGKKYYGKWSNTKIVKIK